MNFQWHIFRIKKGIHIFSIPLTLKYELNLSMSAILDSSENQFEFTINVAPHLEQYCMKVSEAKFYHKHCFTLFTVFWLRRVGQMFYSHHVKTELQEDCPRMWIYRNVLSKIFHDPESNKSANTGFQLLPWNTFLGRIKFYAGFECTNQFWQYCSIMFLNTFKFLLQRCQEKLLQYFIIFIK